MPRKLRTPKARRRAGVQVSDALRYWLTWGDFATALEMAQAEGTVVDLYATERHPSAWAAIVEEALVEWVEAFPGSRPSSWWQWSALELRRVHGRYRVISGIGRCHPSGVPYLVVEDADDRPM